MRLNLNHVPFMEKAMQDELSPSEREAMWDEIDRMRESND